MEIKDTFSSRRGFIKNNLIAATGLAAIPSATGGAIPDSKPDEDNLHIVGPRDGFSPQVGTLLSMMTWMRTTVLRSVQGMTMAELDYLHDPKSNTIGAMLLHLAATEKYYQIHTFEDKGWGTWDDSVKKTWDVPMRLGDEGREKIKGNSVDHYINILNEVRNETISGFKTRDDAWLAKVDPSFFGKKPTNNYCKWFHVCEHESNHNGQIKWIKARLSGRGGN